MMIIMSVHLIIIIISIIIISIITVRIIIIFFVIVLIFFCIRFKCPVRPDLRCRRCADMMIMMTAGDAEDAS